MSSNQVTVLVAVAVVHLALVFYLVNPSGKDGDIVETVSDGLTALVVGV